MLPLLAAAALSAGLMTLSSPPHDQGWLAWLAPVPFFWALLQGSGVQEPRPRTSEHPNIRTPEHLKQAWWSGFVWGFVFLVSLVPWFGAFTPVGYPVAGAYWGLLAGLCAVGAVWLMQRMPPVWAPVLLAAMFTVQEWLRAQGALAFPWGSLASTQYRYLPVLQMLDVTGAYGLTFLMALTAACLAALAVRVPGVRRAGALWGIVALNLAVMAVGRGLWILNRPQPEMPTARVGLVQASESRQAAGAAVVCFSPPWDYESRTAQAVQQGAELIVWPETACEDDLIDDPEAKARLARLLEGSGAHLLAGSFVEHQPSRMLTNAAVMLAPGGEVLGQYAKVLIVPFGEYLPARPLLGWTVDLGMPEEDLRAGEAWAPVPWDRGTVGVSICFESAFGYVSREMVNRGANMLAVLTSDGWAGRSAAGLQHATFAPLRAVENRRSLARAAATGVSQLIDPYGRPLVSIPMFRRGVVMAEIPLRTDRTLYTRLGDWPVVLSWLLLVGAAVVALRCRGQAV